MKNIKSKKLIKLLSIAAFVLAPIAANAAADPTFNFSGTTANSGGFSETQTKFNTLANMAFYTMYLAGGAVLAGGAFKLKQGDIPGFTKMAAGGGVLFATPTVMTSLKQFSQ